MATSIDPARGAPMDFAPGLAWGLWASCGRFSSYVSVSTTTPSINPNPQSPHMTPPIYSRPLTRHHHSILLSPVPLDRSRRSMTLFGGRGGGGGHGPHTPATAHARVVGCPFRSMVPLGCLSCWWAVFGLGPSADTVPPIACRSWSIPPHTTPLLSSPTIDRHRLLAVCLLLQAHGAGWS